MEYKGDGGTDFYSATPNEAGKGLLMFSKWPPPSKPEEIPMLVRNLADGFVKTAKGSSLGLSTERYEIEQFSGSHCTGSYAVFRVKADRSETLQTVFFMNAEGQIWNGQFTGTAEDWTLALQMLKSVKVNR